MSYTQGPLRKKQTAIEKKFNGSDGTTSEASGKVEKHNAEQAKLKERKIKEMIESRNKVKAALTPFTNDIIDCKGIATWCAPPGSGKSTLVLARILLGLGRRDWNRIIVLCTTNPNHHVYDRLLAHEAVKNGDVRVSIFSNVTMTHIEQIHKLTEAKVREARGVPDERCLLVLDDVYGFVKFKNETTITKLATTYLHHKLDIFTVVHDIKVLPGQMRTACSAFFLGALSENEMKWTHSELSKGFYSYQDFKQWYTSITDADHTFVRFGHRKVAIAFNMNFTRRD